MSNPILQSEQFQRAAYALQHAIEGELHQSANSVSDAACCIRDAVRDFGEFVTRFEAAVERLVLYGPSQ